MNPVDYAKLAKQAYIDIPSVGLPQSASRMHVYGDVHVFRGSDDMESWIADLTVVPQQVWGLGYVHAGFYGALAAILPACLALPRPTAITGHSLGAAMAILYAGVLALMRQPVPVFAFEPPKLCADGTLANLMKIMDVPFYATRNGNDVVPTVPPAMTLPGTLTQIGRPTAPFPNIEDHNIDRVIESLAA